MLDPARLCGALATAAERAGACLVTGVRVLQVDDTRQGPLSVHTERGVIGADRVLLAVNAALPRLDPRFAGVVTPVRAQMHVTAPDPNGPTLRWPVYAHHGYEYWRQEPGGELLFGGCRWAEPAAERGVIDDASVSETVHTPPGLRAVGADGALDGHHGVHAGWPAAGRRRARPRSTVGLRGVEWSLRSAISSAGRGRPRW